MFSAIAISRRQSAGANWISRSAIDVALVSRMFGGIRRRIPPNGNAPDPSVARLDAPCSSSCAPAGYHSARKPIGFKRPTPKSHARRVHFHPESGYRASRFYPGTRGLWNLLVIGRFGCGRYGLFARFGSFGVFDGVVSIDPLLSRRVDFAPPLRGGWSRCYSWRISVSHGGSRWRYRDSRR